MAITNCRVDPTIIEKEIARFLGGKAGRRIVLLDQHFETAQEGVEIVDIRSTPIAALHSIPPPHVLYAVDQDDLGLPFVNYLIEHNIKSMHARSPGRPIAFTRTPTLAARSNPNMSFRQRQISPSSMAVTQISKTSARLYRQPATSTEPMSKWAAFGDAAAESL